MIFGSNPEGRIHKGCPGGQDPPFGETPNLHKEYKNVGCGHANVPVYVQKFSTYADHSISKIMDQPLSPSNVKNP